MIKQMATTKNTITKCGWLSRDKKHEIKYLLISNRTTEQNRTERERKKYSGIYLNF